MRLTARKQQRQAALGHGFDHLWMGHWHQATFGPQFTVNGSLVGYSAFSAACGALPSSSRVMEEQHLQVHRLDPSARDLLLLWSVESRGLAV
jgi:hypothetical protein